MCIALMCVCSVMSWLPWALDSTSTCEVTSLGSSFSLMCELSCLGLSVSERLRLCAPSHRIGHLYNRLRCVWGLASLCVSSQSVCCLAPAKLRTLCNKSTFLCSTSSFALHWWEPAAPLIVFGVLGQDTQKFVFTIGAHLCVLPFSPTYSMLISFHSPAFVSWALCAVKHDSVNNSLARSAFLGCCGTMWW